MPARARSAAGRLSILAAVVSLGCSDSTAPPLPSHEDARSIRFTVLPGDTVITERGVLFGVRHTRLADADNGTLLMGTTVTVLVDPGTPHAYSRGVSGLALRTRPDGEPTLFWAPVSVDGRHTIALRVKEESGEVQTASFTREFRVPELAYDVAELPGLGGDTSAALGVNERGEVAGWARTAAGRRRAVVWRSGVASVLPADDTLSAIATRINGAGDVLGAVSGPAGTQAQVWRADGAVLPIVADFMRFDGAGPFRCCDRPDDLSEARVAMASRRGVGVVLLDVAGGAVRTFNHAGADNWSFPSINAAGVAVGWIYDFLSASTSVAYVDGRRFRPAAPSEDGERACKPCGGGRPTTQASGLAIDDDGNLVWSDEGSPVYTPAVGEPLYLDRFLGIDSHWLALSRHGGIVVKRDVGDSTLYLWRSSGRTGRVRAEGWRIAELGTVNSSGAIAARGIHVATGRHAALLLTPSAGTF